jgi:hypothetical protein
MLKRALVWFRSFFHPTKTSGKFAIGCVGVFYFLFVGGLCWVTGNVVTAIAFVLLCIKRIAGYHGDEQVMKEIGFSFGRVMWLMIAGALGYGVAWVLPADIENGPGEKGAEMVPAWGVVYFVGLHFFERYVAQLATTRQKNRPT